MNNIIERVDRIISRPAPEPAPELTPREYPTAEEVTAARAEFFDRARREGLQPTPERAWYAAAFQFARWKAWVTGPARGIEYPRPTVGLCFYGPCGAGKTALAEFLRRQIERTAKIRIKKTRADGLVERFVRGERTVDDTYGQSEDDLLLDDLGSERDGVSFGDRWGLADFLKARYEYAYKIKTRYTIATTNLNGLEEIKRRYGSQAASRCDEMLDFILVDGEDRRAKISRNRRETAASLWEPPRR